MMILILMNLTFVYFLISNMSALSLIFMVTLFEVIIYMMVISKKWYHIIILMILLEFFSVKGFLLCGVLWAQSFSPSAMFFFVTLMVCEASLGMSLIISVSRSMGGQNLLV